MKLQYQDLLRYGVDYFRHKAGYTPPVMPVPYDWIGDLEIVVSIGWIAQHYLSKRIIYRFVHIGFPTICDECLVKINPELKRGDGYVTYTSVIKSFANCELCGSLGIERIPY